MRMRELSLPYVFIVTLVAVFALVGCSDRSGDDYTAVATIQLQRIDKLAGESEADYQLLLAENLSIDATLLKSREIVLRVTDTLPASALQALRAPRTPFGATPTYSQNLNEVIAANLEVVANFDAYRLRISYTNSSPEIAVLIANRFAEEFVAYHSEMTVEPSTKAIGDLQLRVDEQHKVVESIEQDVARFNQTHGGELSTQVDSEIQEEYRSLLRDLEVQRSFYHALVSRLNVERESLTQAPPLAHIVDSASLPESSN